jgi:ABC-2 type transport system permease protein
VLRALVRRDWQALRSYRAALISDLAFGFLNLVVFYFISHTVHPTRRTGLQGAPSYFALATAGIALSVVLQAGTVGITRRIREEQLTGTLEILVAQPISSAEIALDWAWGPHSCSPSRVPGSTFSWPPCCLA